VQGKVDTLPQPIGEALAKEAAKVIPGAAVDLPARIRDIADEIVGEPKEHAVILDSDGKQLLHKIGETDAVKFTEDELPMLAGNVMVHNHTGVPQSFSEDDVRLAVWHNMAGMHAVDDLFLYRIERAPGVSWGPALWAQIEPVWQQIKSDVEQRFGEAKARRLIDDEQYDVLLEHAIWTEVAARFKIGYARVPRKST
jgi:hypothetical protein